MKLSLTKKVGRIVYVANLELIHHFSLTGVITYDVPLKPNQANLIRMGACGDELIKIFPELSIIHRLHLSSKSGIPMHAIANGFYHIQKGFENVVDNKEYFCNYYRVSRDQYDVLKTSDSTDEYGANIAKLGIYHQWEIEAKIATDLLKRINRTQ